MELSKLQERVIEISYDLKLSHLGSVLTALPIVVEVYSTKSPIEKFINDSGHSHLAHAVVMESLGIIPDAKENIITHGIHCESSGGCDFSTGSLGMGVSAAAGLALADRNRNVWCLVTEGSCAEGVFWEVLRFAHDQDLNNLKIFCNFNSWSAYTSVDVDYLKDRIESFRFHVKIFKTTSDFSPIFSGLEAHYKVLEKEDVNKMATILNIR